MAKQILDDIDLFPIQEKLLEKMESESDKIKLLLNLWENGQLSRQDLIDEMPAVFSPPENVPAEPISGVEHLFYSGLMSAEDFTSAQAENSSNIVTNNGISMEYHEGLLEQMAEVQPVSEQLEQAGYTSQEILDVGMVYAPYIPLYQTPTVQLSDLKAHRFYTGWGTKSKKFVIKKYNDIYSDIKERFKILDL